MKHLRDETEANCVAFSAVWEKELQQTIATLSANKQQYLESYRRLVSLQAWKTELLSKCLTKESLEFYVEAQNDGLTSHVLAGMGFWRSALKALRSCIENIAYCLYYKDHPVECQLWAVGEHRLTFTELMSYFGAHPSLDKIPAATTGLSTLTSEFSTLSRAVHGTGRSFRMTAETGKVQVFTPDSIRLNMWQTRARSVVTGINQLLLALYRNELSGNRLTNLRKSISLGIPQNKFPEIKRLFNVQLFR